MNACEHWVTNKQAGTLLEFTQTPHMLLKLQRTATKFNYRHWMRGIRVGSKRHSLRRHASWSKGFRLGEHIMWVLPIAVEYLFRYLGPGWGQCQQTPSSGTVQNACGQARGIQAETTYPNQSSNSLSMMFNFHYIIISLL